MCLFKTSFRALCVLGFALLTLNARAASADWPQWRGPNRDGISPDTGLLKEWPTGGPALLWKASGLGAGFSSVAIANQRIYTIGDQRGSSFVVALNAADGRPLWSAKLGKTGAPGWGGYTGPRSTPAVAGESLVALGQWGELLCLDTASGKERWRKDCIKDFSGSRPGWGFAETPLIDGDRAIVTPGGSQGAMVALDVKTGAVLWRSKDFIDEAHYASVIVGEIDGVRQYIQLSAASVVGIDPRNGRTLWRAARKGETAVIPTPIYADNHVYVTSGYGVGCHLFKITSGGGSFSAEQVYANKVMVNHHGGVVKIGDYVYGYSDGKGWTCQDFKTGEAKWQEKEKLGKGSLVAADGQLYLRQENKPGTVALVEITPDGFKEHGRFNPPSFSDDRNWAHPVVAGGKLYLREQDFLFCYDVQKK
jgi:outer membrane protein assembly factor BamB